MVSKDRLKQKGDTMESDDDIEELSDKEDKTKKIKKEKKFKTNKDKNNKEKKENDNSELSSEKIKDAKEGIYIFEDANKNKLLFSFHKISNDGLFYELRCKDRACKGRAKYDIQNKDIKKVNRM